jgi:hypothetical protein
VTTQEWRPPKYFAEEVGLRQTDRDIRIAGFHWMRQSMVFYARREVTPMREIDDLNEFLSVPRPAYAIMRLEIWEIVATRLKVPVRVIARRFEMLSRGDVIVIANEYVPPD